MRPAKRATTGLFAKVTVEFEPIAVEQGVVVVNKIRAGDAARRN